MNKIIIGLIILLVILATLGVGVYYAMSPQYQIFEDENICVEIPSDLNFKLNDSSDSFGKMLSYDTNNFTNETEIEIEVSIFEFILEIFNPNNRVEPFTGIEIISINPETDYAYDSYIASKNQLKEDFNKHEKIDSSKHNYEGIIFDQNYQAGLPPVYAILIFDDSNMTIKILSSTDLNTVIRMAETLKVK